MEAHSEVTNKVENRGTTQACDLRLQRCGQYVKSQDSQAGEG